MDPSGMQAAWQKGPQAAHRYMWSGCRPGHAEAQGRPIRGEESVPGLPGVRNPEQGQIFNTQGRLRHCHESGPRKNSRERGACWVTGL